MADTGYATFSTTVEKTNRVLKDIEEAYGWPSEQRQLSYRALRAVLHALRDRLTVVEAADLAAQLPILIRGLYYEGWAPARVPVKMDREAFLDRVERGFAFEVDGGTETLIQRVLGALHRFVTDGEWDDIRASMPRDLAPLVA
jgi:uncharacterized protein (DUF2267 family)